MWATLAAEVFEYLPVEDQEKMLLALGTEDVARILNDISPDDRTALLEELPSKVTLKLIALLNPEQRKIATDLLGYPPQSIGRRMTPDRSGLESPRSRWWWQAARRASPSDTAPLPDYRIETSVRIAEVFLAELDMGEPPALAFASAAGIADAPSAAPDIQHGRTRRQR